MAQLCVLEEKNHSSLQKYTVSYLLYYQISNKNIQMVKF